MLNPYEVNRLLGELRVKLGLCLPPVEQELFKAKPPPDVRASVDAVFTAEGLYPEMAERHLYRKVRDLVADVFRRVEYHDA